jgi:hypothetical protein
MWIALFVLWDGVCSIVTWVRIADTRQNCNFGWLYQTEYQQSILASLLSVAEGINIDSTRSYFRKRLTYLREGSCGSFWHSM